MTNTGRLRHEVKWPTREERIAANAVRKLADEYANRAMNAQDAGPSREDEADFWWRAEGIARSEARELDDDIARRRVIQLSVEEANALSDLMDHHPDASYGSSWRIGYVACIDWDGMQLIMRSFPGHMIEAMHWEKGMRRDPFLYRSIFDKLDDCWRHVSRS